MAVKTEIRGNSVTVKLDFTKMERKLHNFVKKFESEEMKNELQEFGKDILERVIRQYVRTASNSKEMLRRRTRLYGDTNPLAGYLASQLRNVFVAKYGEGWRLLVGKEDLYQGDPYYALLQEIGTSGAPMTSYVLKEYTDRHGNVREIIHPGLPAREFLLTGAQYGFNNVKKRINQIVKKWRREAVG